MSEGEQLAMRFERQRQFDALPPLIKPETFPARYKIHKYWGKKPANVVASYIANYSEPGDCILDIFSGSGVVLCEAMISHRNAVAVDLNPIANLIARVTIEGADLKILRATADEIMANLAPLRAQLFSEKCGRCSSTAEIISTGFDETKPFRLTLDCPHCGTVEQAPRIQDQRMSNQGVPNGSFPDGDIFPGWEMQKLVRKGITRWSELFTPRNLTAVSSLHNAIQTVADIKIRNALTVSFTAHLAQASRMIADYRDASGGPSWKLNCYWLPKKWQELNPFRFYSNRLNKTIAGLKDAQEHINRKLADGVDYSIHSMSSTDLLHHIAKKSVGYIFTDPPYGGEGIQYGELSMLWNLWAGFDCDLRNEVAFNPYQKKTNEYYEKMLSDCFAAAHEALDSGSWMSVTFANKDTGIWQALLTACKRAGFSLNSIVPISPSASNITNKVMKGAPKTDLILNFRKSNSGKVERTLLNTFSLSEWIQEEALYLAHKQGHFRLSELYDRLVIRWFTYQYANPEQARMETFTVYQVVSLLTAMPGFESGPNQQSLDAIWYKRSISFSYLQTQSLET